MQLVKDVILVEESTLGLGMDSPAGAGRISALGEIIALDVELAEYDRFASGEVGPAFDDRRIRGPNTVIVYGNDVTVLPACYESIVVGESFGRPRDFCPQIKMVGEIK